MSPRRTSRSGSPLTPTPDLPAEDTLERTSAPPEADWSHDGLLFDGVDASGVDATDAKFTGCVLNDCRADDLVLTGARVLDCRIRGLSATTAPWRSSTWQEVVLEQTRIGALTASTASMTRVAFTGGRIDFANLRESSLTDVTFTDCDLRDLDAMGAHLTRVRFENCRLGSLELSAARLRDVDVSTSELEGIAGVESLRGLTISEFQLTQLAPALAAHVGLTVVP